MLVRLKGHFGMWTSRMHDDVQLRESAEATAVLRSQHTEAGLVNKRLTEQVAEICAGPMHGLAALPVHANQIGT